MKIISCLQVFLDSAVPVQVIFEMPKERSGRGTRGWYKTCQVAEMRKISAMTSPTRGDSIMNVEGKDLHKMYKAKTAFFPFYAANMHVHLKNRC